LAEQNGTLPVEAQALEDTEVILKFEIEVWEQEKKWPYFSFPKGKQEPGETEVDCAIR